MWPFKKTLFKDQKTINDLIPKIQEVEYTPDFMWLERHRWCLLFLYDESSPKNMCINPEVLYRGKAFTEVSEWTLWKKKLGTATFPIALRNAGISHNRRIKGNIFAVRPSLFWNGLDSLFENTIEFSRERVKILRPRRQGNEQFIDKLTCHMYVGKNDYWINQIDNGYQFGIVKAFNPKVNWIDGYTFGSYYSYTHLEDETNF